MQELSVTVTDVLLSLGPMTPPRIFTLGSKPRAVTERLGCCPKYMLPCSKATIFVPPNSISSYMDLEERGRMKPDIAFKCLNSQELGRLLPYGSCFIYRQSA